MSLESTARLGHLELETSLLAASSSATSRLKDLQDLNRTAVGAIIIKSGTMLEREGNPETNYYSDGRLVVNAKGLPGPDIDGTMSMLEEFNTERTKPIILSLAGMKPEEYLQLVHTVRDSIGKTFDGVELNLSCPNVEGKPIISYDPEATEGIAKEILTEFPGLCLGVKIAPFFTEEMQSDLRGEIQTHLNRVNSGWSVEFDNQVFHGEEELSRLAGVTNKLRPLGMRFVSATNTFPNCRLLDRSGRPIINPRANLGRAGLSGHFLRSISIANVRTLKAALQPEISIIGTGGVADRATADQFFVVGADMVAIGSALVDRGPKAVQQIFLD